MRTTARLARAPYGASSTTVPQIPAPARRHGPPRRAPGERRDWRATDRRLRARGDLRLLVDPEWLASLVGDGRASTRGRPYDPVLIEHCCARGAATGLALRQVSGLCAMLLGLAGAAQVAVPDHSSICRRRREIGFRPPPRRAGPITIAIDATGVTLSTPGPWTKDKYGDKRRSRFVKLHAAIDVAPGTFVAAVVTDAAGEGTGDVSVGPELIDEAAASGPLAAVLADRAYEARECYEAARRAGGVLLKPPKDNARRGLHPDRDRHLAQIGRLGCRCGENASARATGPTSRVPSRP
ncbi:MAG: transposase [Actinomycetota bacterium]|nr:transposase [Actinomycetota bacterium]